MTRAALVMLLVVAAGAVALVVRGGSSAGGDVRVDVIFDNSRGLLPGQFVEVAGGRVGSIAAVRVTPDFKARIELRVKPEFAAFRTDATCTIRAQGLLAENYVQCDPGTPAAPALRGRDGRPPTVAVEHTTQPVSLGDLFSVWSAPTSERLRVLITELGIASGRRGGDMNAILRRANPALAHARQVIDLLEGQRAELLQSVDATGVVVRDLARARRSVPALLHHSAAVLARTERHAKSLDTAVARLPAMLQAARPALRGLDTVAAAGTPLLQQATRAAPGLTRLSGDIGPLAAAARPTLAALGPVLDRGAVVVRRARPLTVLLARYAKQSLPSAQLSGRLLTDLSEHEFVPNLLRFFYNAASATARFDSTSHMIPAHVSFSSCSSYATQPVAGCSANFSDTARPTTPARRAGRPARAHRPAAGGQAGLAPSAPTPAAPTPPAATPAGPLVPAPALPEITDGSGAAVNDLLDWLLG